MRHPVSNVEAGRCHRYPGWALGGEADAGFLGSPLSQTIGAEAVARSADAVVARGSGHTARAVSRR